MRIVRSKPASGSQLWVSWLGLEPLNLCFNTGASGGWFLVTLLTIVLLVLAYSTWYIKGTVAAVAFVRLLLGFVARMVGVRTALRALWLIACWDLLGLRRFALVLFYLNWESNSRATNTAMINRRGDFLLVVGVAPLLRERSTLRSNKTTPALWRLAAITKRANVPFNGWLPKAIAAPTPVRALVHRRTLVVAGFLILEKQSALLGGSSLNNVFLVLAASTILVAGLCGVVEKDFKKTVALRTLSQLGLVGVNLSLKFYAVAVVHVISHALFKRLLFITAGVLMHVNQSNQDLRKYLSNATRLALLSLRMLTSLSCLIGLAFTGGLIRKDLLLSKGLNAPAGALVALVYFSGVFLTYAYRLTMLLSLYRVRQLLGYPPASAKGYLAPLLVDRGLSISFVHWFNNNYLIAPYSGGLSDLRLPLLMAMLAPGLVKHRPRGTRSLLSYKLAGDHWPQAVYLTCPRFRPGESWLQLVNNSLVKRLRRALRTVPLGLLNHPRAGALLFLGLFVLW